jgi:hypothetical protein
MRFNRPTAEYSSRKNIPHKHGVWGCRNAAQERREQAPPQTASRAPCSCVMRAMLAHAGNVPNLPGTQRSACP